MASKIRHYAGLAMVALYSAMGLMFLFTDVAIDIFPSYRQGVGITLLIYAALRLLLTLRKLKQVNEENR